MAENTRLTDLTRMLLSSSAFSTFLNDLSGNSAAPSSSTLKPQLAEVKVEQTQPRKDVNPNQAAASLPNYQSTPQIGMALIPETTVNHPTPDPITNTWDNGTIDFGLFGTQVFAVMELPRGPAVDHIDTGSLSGKPSDAGSYPAGDVVKDGSPTIECMPIIEKSEEPSYPDSDDSVDLDESDPAFALFADYPSPRTAHMENPEDRLFGHIEPEKAFSRLELIIEGETDDEDEVSAATMGKFERLCSSLEAASVRIAAIVRQP